MNTPHFSIIRHAGITACVLALLTLAVPAGAQRVPGDVGLGVHVGQPTGVTLKVYNEVTSVDFLAAWDLDDFFFLNIHAIYDVHLNDEGTVHFYYGPGGYIGIRDRREGLDDEVEIGVSVNFGLDFMIRKFEIFVQGTPRLSLVESTNFDMGGGVGFRVYF
jgi:hypothetical protein